MPSPEKIYQLIAKHTTDLVCLHDDENTIRFATPSSAGVLGFPPSKLVGNKLTDFLTEDFINEMDFSTLMRFFDQPGARIRYQVLHADNRLRWLETTFTELQEEELSDYRFLSTTRDITESVHLTDDLMQALSTEQELSKLKTNLYSVASHEFKTPLAVIQANIEMLKVKQTPKLLETGLAAMEEEIDNLNYMIGDMLELKKLTSGRRNFHSSPVDLDQLMQEVVGSQVDRAGDKVQIDYTCEGKPFKVNADYSLIRYVFSNLVTNAIKFSPKQGKLAVKVDYQDPGEVQLVVQDNGIGIPEEEQKAIFQSFYRANNVGNIPGTGVGLAIVSEFVKLHKGKIKVKSQPGEGSAFTVTLPK